MAVNVITFAPASKGIPFQFTARLDNVDYRAAVKWNTFGQRWYLSLVSSNGTLIFNQALVGTTQAVQIESLKWANGLVTMKCAFPHTFKIGDTNWIDIYGCLPDLYNGRFLAFATDLETLVYRVPDSLPQATALGYTTYEINLADTYFHQSRLVFRAGTQQFEVSP